MDSSGGSTASAATIAVSGLARSLAPGPPVGAPAAQPVPMEFIGKARALRGRIAANQDHYLSECERIILPLRPRPGWPAPGKPSYLRGLARKYRLLASPCRLFAEAEVRKRNVLAIYDLYVTASCLRFNGWSINQPSLRVALRVISTSPFDEFDQVLAEVGLHALARRFERGRDSTVAGVLGDLRVFAVALRRAIRTDDDEFAIPTPSGGRWRGQLTQGGAPVAVRTFVA